MNTFLWNWTDKYRFVGFCPGTLLGVLSMVWFTFTRSFTQKTSFVYRQKAFFWMMFALSGKWCCFRQWCRFANDVCLRHVRANIASLRPKGAASFRSASGETSLAAECGGIITFCGASAQFGEQAARRIFAAKPNLSSAAMKETSFCLPWQERFFCSLFFITQNGIIWQLKKGVE